MEKGDLPQMLKNARDLVAKVDLKEEEFLVAAVLIFWNNGSNLKKNLKIKRKTTHWGDLSISDEVRQIGERYRADVLKELHAFYRYVMGLDDYATRLGQLMMLMQLFEVTSSHSKYWCE